MKKNYEKPSAYVTDVSPETVLCESFYTGATWEEVGELDW